MTYDSLGHQRRTPRPPRPQIPGLRIIKWAALPAVLLLLLISVVGCGAFSVSVPAGEVGVKTAKVFSPGVRTTPLGTGFHLLNIGEEAVLYPVTQRTYPFTRAPDERGQENEEILFTDRTGLPMTADVNVVLRVRPEAAPQLYRNLRLTFDQLIDGPIRNDIRTAIAAETEQVSVDQLLAGGRQAVIQRALARVQRKWSPLGVEISQLEWIGSIRFPQVISDSITARTRADQEVNAALARVAVAEAEAQVLITEAQGIAESNRIRGEALRAFPERLRQIEIEQWNGLCPLESTTCVVGQNAGGIVNGLNN